MTAEIYPTSHGADPTGAADSLPAWDAAQEQAHATGLPIRWPTGDFRFSDTMRLKYENLTVVGDGKGSTRLFTDQAQTLIRVGEFDPGELADRRMKGIEISDMALECRATNPAAGALLDLDLCGDTNIRNVAFRGGHQAIVYRGTGENTVVDGNCNVESWHGPPYAPAPGSCAVLITRRVVHPDYAGAKLDPVDGLHYVECNSAVVDPHIKTGKGATVHTYVIHCCDGLLIRSEHGGFPTDAIVFFEQVQDGLTTSAVRLFGTFLDGKNDITKWGVYMPDTGKVGSVGNIRFFGAHGGGYTEAAYELANPNLDGFRSISPTMKGSGTAVRVLAGTNISFTDGDIKNAGGVDAPLVDIGGGPHPVGRVSFRGMSLDGANDAATAFRARGVIETLRIRDIDYSDGLDDYDFAGADIDNPEID